MRRLRRACIGEGDPQAREDEMPGWIVGSGVHRHQVGLTPVAGLPRVERELLNAVAQRKCPSSTSVQRSQRRRMRSIGPVKRSFDSRTEEINSNALCRSCICDNMTFLTTPCALLA